MKTPKLIATEGTFEIYRAGHVLIVNRHGRFFCNLRKADRGFRDPAAWCAGIDRVAAEEEAREAEQLAVRRARVDAYLAARAERKARSPEFQF